MKIWGQIPQIQEVYGKNKSASKVDKASSVSSKKDVVSISNQGKDFQAALKTAREVPDIRAGKVDEIKNKIQSGNYDVNANDVADKVINSILNKEI